ncbi:hypothetical protein A2U01_0095915, partial [Trifolium medium]|nr:hypothetical protein [Trifolium medium]
LAPSLCLVSTFWLLPAAPRAGHAAPRAGTVQRVDFG